MCIKTYKHVLNHTYHALMPLLVFVAHLQFLFFELMLEYQAYMLECVFWLHQLQVLCDHQELAYTPKGPPRRVDVNLYEFQTYLWTFFWVIDITVSTPTLTPLRVAEILLFSRYVVALSLPKASPLSSAKPDKMNNKLITNLYLHWWHSNTYCNTFSLCWNIVITIICRSIVPAQSPN